MPDPEAMALFEESGCVIVGTDTCTGARLHVPYDYSGTQNPYEQLARSLLSRPPCARSILPQEPLALARLVLESAQRAGARGVVAHVMKFCDPYLARIPIVFKTLREAKMPTLLLEGDCTLRSFGQYRTRIEAFREMLDR
jgi:benzoyl-CoA reductase/2-hydroxyglutaryl-CoA dehydratase subunit BcrC/BadD/HgdB